MSALNRKHIESIVRGCLIASQAVISCLLLQLINKWLVVSMCKMTTELKTEAFSDIIKLLLFSK